MKHMQWGGPETRDSQGDSRKQKLGGRGSKVLGIRRRSWHRQKWSGRSSEHCAYLAQHSWDINCKEKWLPGTASSPSWCKNPDIHFLPPKETKVHPCSYNLQEAICSPWQQPTQSCVPQMLPCTSEPGSWVLYLVLLVPMGECGDNGWKHVLLEAPLCQQNATQASRLWIHMRKYSKGFAWSWKMQQGPKESLLTAKDLHPVGLWIMGASRYCWTPKVLGTQCFWATSTIGLLWEPHGSTRAISASPDYCPTPHIRFPSCSPCTD
jgi:hypothetical protein